MKIIVKSLKRCLSGTVVLSVSLASSMALADDQWDARNEPVRECGNISVQGGSLVINGRARLVVGDAALQRRLQDEASRGPVSLCLLGKWESTSVGMVFRATRLD